MPALDPLRLSLATTTMSHRRPSLWRASSRLPLPLLERRLPLPISTIFGVCGRSKRRSGRSRRG
jgi:hypothetical protein